MFNWLKKKSESKINKQPTETRTKKKTPKDLATEAGDPYINIVSIELDPENIGNGSFELDWNDVFVAKLVKSGFMMKKDDTDAQIVDRWFQSICRNIIQENYEQWEVNQPVDARPRRIDRNDIGNGRIEIS